MVSVDAYVEALLEGPRGRRVCLDFAASGPRAAQFAADPSTLTPDPLVDALFWGAFERDSGAHTAVVFSRLSDDDDQAGDTGDDSIPSAPPVEEIGRLIDALPLSQPTDAELLECLHAAVESARYWQEPDGTDALAADPELRPALRRVARVIAGSGMAEWWHTGVDSGNQWTVEFDYDVDVGETPAVSAKEAHELWLAETQREEAAARGQAVSGSWWSTPTRRMVRTTRAYDGRGPLGLALVEDGLGWRTATVRRVAIAPTARVFEIRGASDWAELCIRYPLDVSDSRRSVWGEAVGRDGAWVIPNWARVADDFDGVHLTVAGYLNAAGRAIPLGDQTASVLAGWDPDQTVWLRDGVVGPELDSQSWSWDHEGEWRRA